MITHFKDIFISNLIHWLIKYYSDPSLLSEQAQSKLFKSFPKVEAPVEQPEVKLRKDYKPHTFTWTDIEYVEDKPLYKNPLIIAAVVSFLLAGVIYYFSDDISTYFKGDDGGNNQGPTNNFSRKIIDNVKPDFNYSSSDSSSSTDTITLNPMTSSTTVAEVISSNGKVNETIASSSNLESSSRLRFSPRQTMTPEDKLDYDSMFKSTSPVDSKINSPASPDSPLPSLPNKQPESNIFDIWKTK